MAGLKIYRTAVCLTALCSSQWRIQLEKQQMGEKVEQHQWIPVHLQWLIKLLAADMYGQQIYN